MTCLRLGKGRADVVNKSSMHIPGLFVLFPLGPNPMEAARETQSDQLCSR